MVGTLQPLDQKFAIVDAQGRPTDYFTRWAQQRQIDIGDGITEQQAQQIIDDWAAARQIIAGRALDGGGDLSGDVTLDHSESLVVAGTYGDATHVPQFVVDQEGHIQGVTEVAISGGGGATATEQSVPNGMGSGGVSHTGNNIAVRPTYLRAGTVCTGVNVRITTASGGATSSVALYSCNSSMTAVSQLAVSANQTAYVVGDNQIPFTAPYTIPTDDWYYIGFVASWAVAFFNCVDRRMYKATAGGAWPAAPISAFTSDTNGLSKWLY